MAKKRKLSISIFIACEGGNTEPLYFEKIKEVMEEQGDYPYAITVYPDKEYDEKPKSDAIGLINVAIDRKNDFDELWVVFDKDGYTKHKEAFELAQDNNINIAFSSISFEIWFLLHFERTKEKFEKSANIIQSKFHNGYLRDYAKSGDYNVYPSLEGKTVEVFKNASWLRNCLKIANPEYIPYEVNPYTDVDCLVKKLFLDDCVYEFRTVGENLVFDGIEILVVDTNGEYFVKIVNKTDTSLALNEFSFYDFEMNKINLTNCIIAPRESCENGLNQKAAVNFFFIEFRKLKLEIGSF